MKKLNVSLLLIGLLMLFFLVSQMGCKDENKPAPVAAFSGTPTSGTIPLTVNFTDQSTNSPTNWAWNFGDGGTSTQQNPSHTYNSAGTYTVKLTATNSYGSDIKEKTDYIVVSSAGNAPVAAFTGTPTSGTAPLTVNFTDQSTNTPTSWQWNFGDGGTSTQQSPSHTYNSAGTYTVELLVSNGYGSDTEIKNNHITVTTGEPCPGIPTVTYEGQVYNTVLIGSQCWLKENLNVGIMIGGTFEQTDNGTIEKYCYDNLESNCNIYGGLYQWNEAMQYGTQQGVRGICPPGWHVPTDDEWKILEGTVDSQYGVGDPEWDDTYFRGYDAGKNLKSTNGWISNGNGTDLYGFSALPGGYRSTDGSFFHGLGDYGNWWSSTELSSSDAWRRYLGYYKDEVFRIHDLKTRGLSLRCLKDN